jgi:hypothetical protein
LIDDRARAPQPLDDGRCDADRRTVRNRDDIGDIGAANAWKDRIRVDFRACSHYVCKARCE